MSDPTPDADAAKARAEAEAQTQAELQAEIDAQPSPGYWRLWGSAFGRGCVWPLSIITLVVLLIAGDRIAETYDRNWLESGRESVLAVAIAIVLLVVLIKALTKGPW